MLDIIRSLALVVLMLTSCQIKTNRSETSEQNGNSQGSTLVDPKYSISQDRSEFDQLRESIPKDKKKINDEKALLAEWMNGFRLSPSDIREKFDNLIRKKREIFSSDLNKIRDQYTKTEKKNQDEFLKSLAEERSDFSSRKRDSEARNEFFSELDTKRKNFFSEQKEKRDDFELKILAYAHKRRLPLLGICRGLQITNVFLGGSLIADIGAWGRSDHKKTNDGIDRTHPIWLPENTFLGEITGTTRGEVNSAHHQAIDILGEGLSMNSVSPDGVLEGAEIKDRDYHPFLMLVQWHPERMAEQGSVFSKNIREAFLDAVAKNL